MKLTQLKDMLAIIETRSFRAAARHLKMTQPAISRSVNALERELGVTLFARHKRGAVLTPLGERFAVRARSAMLELTRARDELAQLAGQSAGTITLCMSSGAQARLLPRVLKPFRVKFPGVRIRLIEGLFQNIERNLRDGQVDFYVGPEPVVDVDHGLVVETLFSNPLVIIARRHHPLIGVTSILELEDAQWLGATMTRQVDNLQELFTQHGLKPPSVTMLCETSYALILALAHTDLLALVPEPLVKLGASQGLAPIKVRERMQGSDTVLAHRSESPLTPAAEHFTDLLRRDSAQRASVSPALKKRCP